MPSDLPRILVLGGVGMIGRNFVKFCVDNELCSYIRVADKAMPMTSYFSKEHSAAFDSDIVEVRSPGHACYRVRSPSHQVLLR